MSTPTQSSRAAANGRLLNRPTTPSAARAPGPAQLGLGDARDGLLHVPATAPAGPAPLFVALHGAGGDAPGMLGLLRKAADATGTVLLLPESRGSTWDVLRGGFGPDVAFVDEALAAAFARIHVDPERVAIGGFSDGASYALSLGLANGDLFGRVIAFSPGFAAPPSQAGRPRIFVSHGTDDPVLPIVPCSRKIVGRLEAAGYDVTYVEFEGGHEVPGPIAARALAGLASGD